MTIKIISQIIKLIVVCFGLTMAVVANGQSSNPRETNPWGLNLNLAGPTLLLSGSLDYFITSSWDVEAGTGLIGYFVGTKLYLNGARAVTWTPYLGSSLIHLESTYDGGSLNGLYFPIGVQHWGSKKFSYALEIAYIRNDVQIDNKDQFFGSIRLGWRLKSRKDN